MITGKTHVYFPIIVKHWIKHCVNRKVLGRNARWDSVQEPPRHTFDPAHAAGITQMLGDMANVLAQLPSVVKNTQAQRGAQLSLVKLLLWPLDARDNMQKATIKLPYALCFHAIIAKPCGLI